MFSNRIRISGLLLILSHCSHSFVLLTANIDDVKKIARKFVSESMAQQLAEVIARAAGQQPTSNLSEENERHNEHEENMSDNEIKRIQRQGATSKRYKTLTRRTTTWTPKAYDDLWTKIADGFAKNTKQVIQQPPKSKSRLKPQSYSQVNLEKQINHQLEQQIDKLQGMHSKDTAGDRNVDKLNQKLKRPSKMQRLPQKQRKRKRPDTPSQNYQNPENSYYLDQAGYQTSQQNYRRPQQEYEKLQQENKSAQQEYKNSQQEYKNAQREYKSPQQEYRSSQSEYSSPQQEHRSPQQEDRSPQKEYRSPQKEYRSPQKDYQNLEQGYQNSSNTPQQPGNYQNQNQKYQTVKPDYGSPNQKKPKPYKPDYESQVKQLEDSYDVDTDVPTYKEKKTANQNPYTSDGKSRRPSLITESDQTNNTSGNSEQTDYIEPTKYHRLRARPPDRFILQENDIPENETVNTQPTMIIEFSSRYNGFNIEPKEGLTTEREKVEFDQYDHPEHLIATAGPVGLKAGTKYWQGYPRQSLSVQGVNSTPTLTSPPVVSPAANNFPILKIS